MEGSLELAGEDTGCILSVVSLRCASSRAQCQLGKCDSLLSRETVSATVSIFDRLFV